MHTLEEEDARREELEKKNRDLRAQVNNNIEMFTT